jgi:hypothetical protein
VRDVANSAEFAVVLTVIVTAAELEPGVTEVVERLQVVFAGAPLQLNFTALEKVPPTEATVTE